jgi:hypothetical protein
MTQDYTEQLAEFWPTIMHAWDEHGKKHPIIEYDLVNRQFVPPNPPPPVRVRCPLTL